MIDLGLEEQRGAVEEDVEVLMAILRGEKVTRKSSSPATSCPASRAAHTPRNAPPRPPLPADAIDHPSNTQ